MFVIEAKHFLSSSIEDLIFSLHVICFANSLFVPCYKVFIFFIYLIISYFRTNSPQALIIPLFIYLALKVRHVGADMKAYCALYWSLLEDALYRNANLCSVEQHIPVHALCKLISSQYCVHCLNLAAKSIFENVWY